MNVRIRTIEATDIESWVACMGVGFLHPIAEGYSKYFLGDVDLERSWGAFESDRVVGTLRSFPTAFTVPGPSEVRAAALTSVTVAPTHRRRGLLTQMVTADLHASAARGEPLGILIAAEYPIYGRFGYGAAIEGATYSVDLPRVRFLHPDEGTVELVDLATMRKEAPTLYDRFRTGQPGSIERDERWWDRALHQVEVPGAKAPEGYQAIYRSPDGAAEGYVRYHASEEWDSMRVKGLLGVDELVAVTPAAYQRLWRYCCEVDLVSKLEAGNRPAAEVLPWLLADGRAARQTGRYDFVWVRILDVAGAVSARRYATEGRLVLEVADPLGIAAGRFALEGGPDGASCGRTDAPAEVSLDVGTLGSAYMGAVPFHVLAAAGAVEAGDHRALARADAMFVSAVTPWCNTWF